MQASTAPSAGSGDTTPASGSGIGTPVLSPAEYLAVMASSPSIKEMARNPFVLRLFVDALPGLKATGRDLTRVTRYDVYSGFVSQWFGLG